MLPALAFLALAARPIVPHVGLTITRSCRFAPGSYLLPTPEGTKAAGGETIPTFTPAIVIRGNGITVDLAGAVLRGTPQQVNPDQRQGLGILVEGRNVTIEHASVHGYKVALMARHAPGLKILDSDFSYNWKQHLRSTLDREDESDWQSYHHNEHDEWLRYGAAISLWDTDRFEVRGTKAEGGQCGLMLTRCGHGLVWNDDFSFMSGLGIGMYRSSDNRIEHNRIDWDVRGFSYGVYNRGQDSAGILVFEQCDRNVVAFNSVTHGGDGFFLWAGQQTMDTGKGGCNDNLVYGNDFSGAPTNGIESTFSRNRFANNLVRECWHGVWDGYAYDTLVFGNDFEGSEVGIATEHGQNNQTLGNVFRGNGAAIQIWADGKPDPTWGYGKARDIRSRDTLITGNRFIGNATTLSQRNSTGTRFLSNYVAGSKSPVSGDVPAPFPPATLDYRFNVFGPGAKIPPGADATANFLKDQYLRDRDFQLVVPSGRPWNPWKMDSRLVKGLSPLKGGQNPFLKPGALRGWKYILVDEWGPYDFKRPLLWPRGDVRPGRKRFEILGPKGRWRVVATAGVTRLSQTGGTAPGFVDVDLPVGKAGLTKIDLRYVGGATTDYRGVVTPAGRPVAFGYSHFFAPIAWDVKFFRWTRSEDPGKPHSAPKDFDAVLRTTPIEEVHSDRLDFAGGAFVPGLPTDHYGTLAEGTFSIPAGDYTFDLTTDDGARVWLDGKPLVEDAWHYQAPTAYSKTVHLDGGRHRLRVEHFQIDGYAKLKLDLKPAR